jgi:protein SCO1/2
MNMRRSILAVLATTGLFLSATSVAQETRPALPTPPKATDPEMPRPREVEGLDVEERVGLPLPMELQFTTSEGRVVQLGDYFKSNKPAVIAMVYYKCPVVCDIVMQRLTQSFSGMDYVVGEDFNALYFSFDSSETPEDAAAAKRGHLSNYSKPATPAVEAGWQFHVADADSARQLADAVGFKYRRLANGQFSHPAAIFVITPEGRISRYMYGYDYPSRDMKLSLIDATNGKLVKSLGDRFLSWCYMYDPSQGKYSLAAMRVMQLSGVISALFVGALVGTLFVGERIRRRLGRSPDGGQAGGDSGDRTGDPPSQGATA